MVHVESVDERDSIASVLAYAFSQSTIFRCNGQQELYCRGFWICKQWRSHRLPLSTEALTLSSNGVAPDSSNAYKMARSVSSIF